MKTSDDLSVWEEPEERGKGHNRNDNEDGLEEKGCSAIGGQGRSIGTDVRQLETATRHLPQNCKNFITYRVFHIN